MGRKYRLQDKEFWIEIVSVSELRPSIFFSRDISASSLKRAIQKLDCNRVYITSSLPDIYVQLGSETVRVAYRPFLGFLSRLEIVEDDIVLQWQSDGF